MSVAVGQNFKQARDSQKRDESAHKPPRCLAQPWTEDALHG